MCTAGCLTYLSYSGVHTVLRLNRDVAAALQTTVYSLILCSKLKAAVAIASRVLMTSSDSLQPLLGALKRVSGEVVGINHVS